MSWRDTARRPEIFGIDARVVLPVALWAFHIAWWTFAVMIVGIGFFVFSSRLGYTPNVLLRRLRRRLAGGVWRTREGPRRRLAARAPWEDQGERERA